MTTTIFDRTLATSSETNYGQKYLSYLATAAWKNLLEELKKSETCLINFKFKVTYHYLSNQRR